MTTLYATWHSGFPVCVLDADTPAGHMRTLLTELSFHESLDEVCDRLLYTLLSVRYRNLIFVS